MPKNPLTLLTEKLENAKPSAMEPEKKEKTLKAVKRIAVAAGISLVAVTVVSTVKYYSAISEAEANTSEEMITED